MNEGVNEQTKAYNFKEKPPFQLHAQELELAGCDGGVWSLTVYIASRQPTPLYSPLLVPILSYIIEASGILGQFSKLERVYFHIAHGGLYINIGYKGRVRG